jgi:chemotaxis protein MotB
MSKDSQPIIIKKIKKAGHGGHHGGAWKVAYADFVTAMMALFLVLWLVAMLSVQTKQAIAEYFRSHSILKGTAAGGIHGISEMKGAPVRLDPESGDTTEGSAFRDSLQMQLAQLIEQQLLEMKDQILMSMTKDGIRIELVEKFGSPMFRAGTAELTEAGEQIMGILAIALNQANVPIAIEGHTDNTPISNAQFGSNWEIAASRANTARTALVEHGYNPALVDRITSYADTVPLRLDNPADPMNRRVSILILLNK